MMDLIFFGRIIADTFIPCDSIGLDDKRCKGYVT